MDSIVPLIFVAFMGLLVSVGVWQWWSSPYQVAKRKLGATPAVPISGLRPGQKVKITGRVVLDARLTSPLLGVSCAYWNVMVREKSGKHTHTRLDKWEGVPFWVEDGSGRVWVDPDGTRLTLETEAAGRATLFEGPTEEQQALLEQFGMSATGLLGFSRALSYFEASVHDGEQVSVYGEVALREIAGEPALALIAPADETLLVSDAPVGG